MTQKSQRQNCNTFRYTPDFTLALQKEHDDALPFSHRASDLAAFL